jgi:hypothetical protein
MSKLVSTWKTHRGVKIALLGNILALARQLAIIAAKANSKTNQVRLGAKVVMELSRIMSINSVLSAVSALTANSVQEARRITVSSASEAM